MALPSLISIRASNGQYVSVVAGGGQFVHANGPVIGASESFNLIDRGNGQIALQAAHGQYVCAVGGGGQILVADRLTIGPSETFKLIDRGGGQIALQAAGGQYVCAEAGGGQGVYANRGEIGPWETFKLIQLPQAPGLVCWGANLPLAGSPVWVPGFQVRYATAFEYADGSLLRGPWWSPAGNQGTADAEGYVGAGYALAALDSIARDPRGQAVARRIYRQFRGWPEEQVGRVANNTDTTFGDSNVDPVLPPGMNWRLLPGKLKWISVASDGATWGVNSSDLIYRYEAATNSWTPVSGSLKQISVGSASSVWGVNAADQIFYCDGAAGNWRQAPGSLSNVSVSGDGKVWGVNSSGQVYRRDTGASDWTRMPGVLFSRVSVGSATHVWGISAFFQIWRFNFSTGDWQNMPGSMTAPGQGLMFTDVSVAADGAVYAVGKGGEFYRYDPGAAGWLKVNGIGIQLSAGSARLLRCVTAGNDIFSGFPTGQSATPPGQKLGFDDGVGNAIDLGNPTKLDITGKISIAAWIQPQAGDGIRDIVSRGYARSPDGGVYLRIVNGTYQVGSWNGNDSLAAAPMPAGDVGSWVHLAGVYDGGAWVLYRNGREVARTASVVGAVPVNAGWAIGSRGGALEACFKGSISGVSIWGVALDANGVGRCMNSVVSGTEAGLAGLWPLDEGEVLHVSDCSSRPAEGIRVSRHWPPAAPDLECWGAGLQQVPESASWVSGFAVRYAVGYEYTDGTVARGHWWSPAGNQGTADAEGYVAAGYACAVLKQIACDPGGQSVARRIYRQFRNGGEQVAGRIADNTGTTFGDGDTGPPVGGAALCFGDTATSVVSLGNPAKLNITGKISLMAWIQPQASDGIRDVVARGYAGSPAAEVFLRICDGSYQVGSADGVAHLAAAPMPPGDLGKWVHLAGVHDGARWILYRNGLQLAQSEPTTGAVPVGAGWAIGARGGAPGRGFKGSIRAVGIWSAALDVADVQRCMYDGLWPTMGREAGLAGYWALDEGCGKGVFDRAPLPVEGLLTDTRWATPGAPPLRPAIPPMLARKGQYDWGAPQLLPQAGRGGISFMANAAAGGIRVAISPSASTVDGMYEIFIDEATTSIRRRGQGGVVASAPVGAQAGVDRDLWVMIDRELRTISVGRGNFGQDGYLSYQDPSFLRDARHVAFTTDLAPVTYSQIKSHIATAPGYFLVEARSGAYDWRTPQYLGEPGRGAVTFVANANDVYIGISSQDATVDPMYEIVIGGWNNSQTAIRRRAGGDIVASVQAGLTNPGGDNPLWVSIDCLTSSIDVGRGTIVGEGAILRWTDPSFIRDARYVAFSTWASPIQYADVKCVDPFIHGSDRWMTECKEQLTGKTLAQICLPGTHDSGAYTFTADYADGNSALMGDIREGLKIAATVVTAASGGGFLSFLGIGAGSVAHIIDSSIRNWGKAQNWTIAQQLNAGIRYFDFRVMRYRGVFHVYHGYVCDPLEKVLADLRTFCSRNGLSELVLAKFSGVFNMRDKFSDADHRDCVAFIQDQLGACLYQGSGNGIADTAELRGKTIGQILGGGSKLVGLYDNAPYCSGIEIAPGKRSKLLAMKDGSQLLYEDRAAMAAGGDFGTADSAALLEAEHRALPLYTNAGTLAHLPWSLTPDSGVVIKSIINMFDPTTGTWDLAWLNGSISGGLRRFLADNKVIINLITVDFADSSDVVDLCIARSVHNLIRVHTFAVKPKIY